MNLTQKILAEHLVSGQMIPGEEISIRIDQTLTQDSTGTMAYLQFEAMGVDRVQAPSRSVAYIDHNTLQTGFENADDHQIYSDRHPKARHLVLASPGNGICHQVHLERFGMSGLDAAGHPTATPPRAAVSACWPSVRADWTWRSPWAAAPIISPARRWSTWHLTGRSPLWRSGEGHHPWRCCAA